MPPCIKQGPKRNYDSVSVEELDWSAESQVLIPAEQFWCDLLPFTQRPCDVRIETGPVQTVAIK